MVRAIQGISLVEPLLGVQEYCMQLPLCLLERSQKIQPRHHTPGSGVRFWKLCSFLHLVAFASAGCWQPSAVELRVKGAHRLVCRSSRAWHWEHHSHSAATLGEKEPHAVECVWLKLKRKRKSSELRVGKKRRGGWSLKWLCPHI